MRIDAAGVRLVYYAFDLLHLDGRDTASLPLIERKALLRPLIADIPGLQFNDHETGDGELIFPPLVAQHGAQLFEAQAIPLESDLLSVPNYKAFLTERRKLIANRLNEFLGSEAHVAASNTPSSGQMTLSLSPAETTGVHNALHKRAGAIT
jgi:hypothetical protein